MFEKPKIVEFFAGSGLVRQGLGLWFETVWANDICEKKAAVYRANFGDRELCVQSIEQVSGEKLPSSDLAWASFPCQDLSLAGNLVGMEVGSRSGLFWEWLRVLDEMPLDSRPTVLALENVVGWLVSKGGLNFKSAYDALKQRGYMGGALVLDARNFVPQSRPRTFFIAVRKVTDVTGLVRSIPHSMFHTKGTIKAASVVDDADWIWWNLPKPPTTNISFTDICEFDAPVDPIEKTERLLGMLSPINRIKLDTVLKSGMRKAGTGYKRTRPDKGGEKIQRLEIRFDEIAGCLRTPEGGSSRQVVLLVENGEVRTRLLTVREASRLMGAPPEYKVPGSYNEGYKAMGDGVCAPVAGWIAEHLLSPLCLRQMSQFATAAE